MALEDDRLPVVPVGRSITPSKTSITPSKTSFLRKTTPQRANSLPRTYLVKTVLETQALRSRAVSARRKQRRWENDHLFGSQLYLITKLDEEEADDDFLQNYGLNIEWRSSFKEMLRKPDCLNEFLKCLPNECGNIKKTTHITLMTKEQREDAAWNRVEKRLRSIVSRSIRTDKLKLFLVAIESLLVHFLVEGKTLETGDTSEVMLSALESPTSISTNDGSLQLHLVDSSFYRLLTHAACQFHGLRSKSITVNGKRIMVISRREEGSALPYCLSIVHYLLERGQASVPDG